MLKKMISAPMDWALYTLLGEKQRKKIGDLLSKEQKDKLKQVINGKTFMQRQQLKQIKHHLYNLGFTDRALAEMDAFLEEQNKEELKRLTAWELTLWHANQSTPEGAQKALHYLPLAAHNERSSDQLRRIAIIQAECYELLGERESGKKIIAEMLEKEAHEDLYLAAANLEETVDARVEWINKVFDRYHLQRVSFAVKGTMATYDDLITNPLPKKIEEGPKVSVILPAFQAEFGVRTAIESILAQTWKNLELIVVDDCSPDNTVKTVNEYVQQDARVKLLSTPMNSGPYVARNVAMKEATGEFVTINDADDWSHAEKIETQVKHLMEHKDVMANTSAHARLTEDLQLYRRGTPGRYIFPNMSSIMFRREPVLEKVGFWDSVRFAADGEFKRRLLKVFGRNAYVDLQTGPLSLPRQSVSSLTGSSAFGYNGFFMGVRKEYVESLEYHHKQAKTFYYPYPQDIRPFPVPEPMWPEREEKQEGRRTFDVVIAADFRQQTDIALKEIMKRKSTHLRLGLIQLYQYDLNTQEAIHPEVRRVLDGNRVQMLVYGEKITADQLLVIEPAILEDWQRYRPDVKAEEVNVIVSNLRNPEQCLQHLRDYFGTAGSWYPLDQQTRDMLLKQHADAVLPLAEENWVSQ
ncbi:glycosyltransferase family 2 protein [Shouchella shacheensis]|uniref:glycosyltransferase family 2 protein n=1 Tax=Shouchella shacheensis TaxID=1649580 RepID=UPI00074046C2|nr:glycosyltransferase family A protein [Shouchella shacheensis]